MTKGLVRLTHASRPIVGHGHSSSSSRYSSSSSSMSMVKRVENRIINNTNDTARRLIVGPRQAGSGEPFSSSSSSSSSPEGEKDEEDDDEIFNPNNQV